MESSHIVPNQILISFVGFQGSGKTTLGKILADSLNSEHFEASGIVRNTTGVTERSELPATGKRTKKDPTWLGKAVYTAIYPDEVSVVSGVREQEVHDYLETQNIDIHIFEVVAPAEVRFDRLFKLQKVSSAQDFIEQELREIELGVKDVMTAAQYTIPTSPKTNPNAICRVILKKLKERGVLV